MDYQKYKIKVEYGVSAAVLLIGVFFIFQAFTIETSRETIGPRTMPMIIAFSLAISGTTSKADSKFGQAKYRTEAAPLLLNVRTDGSIIRKGERARLIDFDSKKRIYTVTRISTENDS